VGIKWSLTNICLYLPLGGFNLNHFFELMRPCVFIDYPELKANKKNNIKTVKTTEAEKMPEEKNEILLTKTYIDLLDHFRDANTS
jgi:hypothetical protein